MSVPEGKVSDCEICMQIHCISSNAKSELQLLHFYTQSRRIFSRGHEFKLFPVLLLISCHFCSFNAYLLTCIQHHEDMFL